jgi:hypothetical protein
MSRALNARALSGAALGFGIAPYAFKVGTTIHNCAERRKGLVTDRKPVETDGVTIFREPRYAGVDDWKVLDCWDVAKDRYDDREFKPWLEDSGLGGHVRHVPVYRTAGSQGVSKTRGFIDLFVMSEAYARSLHPALVNDPLHDRLLASVARAIVLLVGDYAASLDRSAPAPGRP